MKTITIADREFDLVEAGDMFNFITPDLYTAYKEAYDSIDSDDSDAFDLSWDDIDEMDDGFDYRPFNAKEFFENYFSVAEDCGGGDWNVNTEYKYINVLDVAQLETEEIQELYDDYFQPPVAAYDANGKLYLIKTGED